MKETQEKNRISSRKLKEISGIGKSKKLLQESRNTGITLIALVVTIVVLLILVGITINLLFNSDGVIHSAQNSKEQQEIAEIREKMELAKMPVHVAGLGKYDVEKYWTQLESEQIIADQTIDVIPTGEGTYEVTTVPGYVFEVTLEPSKENIQNILIDYIGKGENLNIGIKLVNVTTSSIEIELVRTEGASGFQYSIKKQGEEYGVAEEKEETHHTYSNLEQGGIYTIKVEATKKGEPKVVERTVQVGEIPLAIALKNITWSNGQATAVIGTEEGYQIEWQKDNVTEGSWTRENVGIKEVSIPNLVNGSTIFARLYDGINSGKYVTINIMDNKAPEVTIKLSGTIAEIGKGITAQVTLVDNESGINIGGSKWIYNTTSSPIGTEETSYTETFSGTNMPITLDLKATTGGEYYLHILAIDQAGNKTEEISSKVEVSTIPENWKATTEDDPNWYNYGTEVNAPVLGKEMTPIIYVGENNPGNLTSKKWANAITSDGSMWVWIPRYAYQIADNYHTNSATGGTINIEFLQGTTNVGRTGKPIVEYNETTTNNFTKFPEGYVIHPGFEYSSTAEGLWIAKFEASQSDAGANTADYENSTGGTSEIIKIQPGVNSWRKITVNNIYTKCLNYDKDTLKDESLNSHMMKNTEWGAVAYLAQSVYGKNTEVWINPNSNYLTGHAGSGPSVEGTTSTSPYNSGNGPQASTTGNVYGVYDMSGCSTEYTAAYVNNGNGSLTSNAARLINGASYTKDVYTKGSADNSQTNYAVATSKYGDAIFEMSNNFAISNGSWYHDMMYYPKNSLPIFYRGGNYSHTVSAGMFAINNQSGTAVGDTTFRPVLITY